MQVYFNQDIIMSKTDNYDGHEQESVLSVFDIFTSAQTHLMHIPLFFKKEFYDQHYYWDFIGFVNHTQYSLIKQIG